jgi:hypothetical protein
MIDWQLLLGIAGFVGICSFLLWATYEPDEPLPKPELGCIDKGPPESWTVTPGRVRFPTTNKDNI